MVLVPRRVVLHVQRHQPALWLILLFSCRTRSQVQLQGATSPVLPSREMPTIPQRSPCHSFLVNFCKHCRRNSTVSFSCDQLNLHLGRRVSGFLCRRTITCCSASDRATRSETLFVPRWQMRFAITVRLVVSISCMADVAAPADREPDEDRRGTHKSLSCQQSIPGLQPSSAAMFRVQK